MKTYINDKEIAKILHDWKYRGFVVENVFTEEDTEEIKSEMNRLRIERNKKETTWGEYGMYSHPQKESEKIIIETKNTIKPAIEPNIKPAIEPNIGLNNNINQQPQPI